MPHFLDINVFPVQDDGPKRMELFVYETDTNNGKQRLLGKHDYYHLTQSLEDAVEYTKSLGVLHLPVQQDRWDMHDERREKRLAYDALVKADHEYRLKKRMEEKIIVLGDDL
jgi:hypothetical protein